MGDMQVGVGSAGGQRGEGRPVAVGGGRGDRGAVGRSVARVVASDQATVGGVAVGVSVVGGRAAAALERAGRRRSWRTVSRLR